MILKTFLFSAFWKVSGYSVVKVSPDGTLYTSRFEDQDGKKFYYLERIETNLIDSVYPKERQKQIVKNAEKIYKNLIRKVKNASREEDLEDIKEFQELSGLEIPLKRLRELYEEAKEIIEERRFRIFVENMEAKLRDGSVTGEDYRDLLAKMEKSPDGWRKDLEALKIKLEDHFRSELSRKMNRVREAVGSVSTTDIRDLEALKEVKEAREFIARLPRDMQDEALGTLKRTLQEKVVEDRLRTFSVKDLGNRILFGREEFPKFSGEVRRLRWRIKVEEKFLEEGRVFGRLVFEREDGLIVEPKRYNNILREEELKHFPGWVPRYLKHLNGLMSVDRPRVPLNVPFEETPWFVENLERFVSLVKEQVEYQEGVLILEGDAGVGKNFLVEVFSALTGRPLFIVPCNSKMEKEDITFVYEFDPRRGTRRVYSDLVKALQTPGAVIYLDEINTLPPSLVKIFNPLFDYRRYLVLSQGEVVKAHRDVILVGGMNPQNYLGVSELPQDIKSRADIMYVDYPPFQEEGGFYYPDEAIILKNHTLHLKELSREEFTYLWYLVVNGVATERGEKVRTPGEGKGGPAPF
ncbi:MAG: AAA family ATPase [Aquificota bacterium]|nr:AAA family ATPase [Aquificota bacterium]